MKLNPFNQTFGMPPSSYVSDPMIINSMPVVSITPGKPSFQRGITLFEIQDDWTTYNKILSSLGFELSSTPVRLAFIADNFPSDSFTNEYGETFLQNFTDVASQGMQQLAQMTGSTTGTETVQELATTLQGFGEEVGGIGGDIFGGMASGAQGAVDVLNKVKSSKSFGGQMATFVDKMLAGNRIDFPMIWRNSGYTPSYTITVRLYNPNPGNIESTKRHIIGPLGVILALGIPRSTDGKTFNWPFFHKIEAPGLYNLSPGVITNITVVKGGDQQQISFNQKLAMVDVRIDFTSLYGTMVIEENVNSEVERPTIKNYLDSLAADDETKYYDRNEVRTISATLAGSSPLSDRVMISSTLSEEQERIQRRTDIAANRRTPTVTTNSDAPRVSSEKIEMANSLTSQIT